MRPTDGVAGYLARLDVPAGLPASLETLRLLHHRHLDTLAYDNLDIMVGAPPAVDPANCVHRVATVGRAGYCLHQNAALEAGLRHLGFTVRRWHGHVWSRPEQRPGLDLNHLVLEVSDLPTPDNPGGRWWCDAGLGDGFRDPLPIVSGDHVQAPFRYRIDDLGPDGWSFRHDSRGSFSGVEVRDLPAGQDVVEQAHRVLSSPPDGKFTQVVVVLRRRADAAVTLRGVLLTTVDAAGTHEQVLDSWAAWRGALDALALPVGDLPVEDLRALHARMATSHRAWEAAGRP